MHAVVDVIVQYRVATHPGWVDCEGRNRDIASTHRQRVVPARPCRRDRGFRKAARHPIPAGLDEPAKASLASGGLQRETQNLRGCLRVKEIARLGQMAEARK